MKASVQKGFTLIELVVVIVILGILAVTAAPKFLNFSSDAHKAVLKGAVGAMHSAATIYQAATIARGLTGTQTIEGIKGDNYQPWAAASTSTGSVSAGYDTPPEIFKAAGLNTGEWRYRIHVDGTYQVIATPAQKLSIAEPTLAQVQSTSCYFNYKWNDTAAGTSPTITIVDSGC